MLLTKTLPRPADTGNRVIERDSKTVMLPDGAKTTVHVVRYERCRVQPRIICFEKETELLDWCGQHEIAEAISGGFFLRATKEVLGDFWINGVKMNTAQVAAPWHINRGSFHVAFDGGCELGPRQQFSKPYNLMQAGPLLVYNGASQIVNGDQEGFSAASHQFDSDITLGRYPRAAIGTNDTYIWSVACDGRAPGEAGMTLAELAGTMLNLGATDALNLDGGSSASLVSDGKLRNRSRGDGVSFPQGRPIHTAIIFD